MLSGRDGRIAHLPPLSLRDDGLWLIDDADEAMWRLYKCRNTGRGR